MAPFLRSQAAAYVLLPFAAICWAGNHIVARAVAGHAPPVTVSLLRWVVVLVLIGALASPQLRADWPALKANAVVMIFLGLVGGALFGTLQFVALQYTTALNMGVVSSMAPALIVAVSYLLFRDGLGPIQLVGVLVSLLGVLAIVSRLDAARLAGLTFNGGDLIMLLNMVFWAVYCACLRLRPPVHSLSFLFALAAISIVGGLPFAVWEHWAGFRFQPDALTIGVTLYAAFFTTILGYVAWNRAIDLVGAPRASAFLHTIPLFAAVLATTILGEKLMLFHVVGFVLIMAGVSLAARPARSEPARALAGDGPI